jgi:ankyrin repeat protein
MAASLAGNADIVRLLLQHGADPTVGENLGYTAPHGAAFQGHANVLLVLHEVFARAGLLAVPDRLTLLLQFGIELNAMHEDGFTPFHRACWGAERRHTQTVELLLELGVDPHSRGRGGRSCVDMTPSALTRRLVGERLYTWPRDM